ncbi:MAG: preprotein translocase subunit SecA [Betaproteobacteria bacterium AqS2]|uniref:Protein translocase subunit SecA n=1 Tax=Candidatus Amphirhobacter heronislandensis TaxID=1732024 RepID=A0A930XYJ7_9GAMM|nr:preprotein translocase subunit SecA [Betaproteobacteria bacterium AqS2]
MIQALLRRISGDPGERFARRHRGVVAAVNAFEEEFKKAAGEALTARAAALKERLAAGASQEKELPEAFALAREAAARGLGLRPFDVQMLGGYALHRGMVAEMKTGEGKTLVATLPASLAALAGEQVHVVTVNDYLARRDADWMRPVYEGMGLTVGATVQGATPEERQAAYRCDVVYGTNNQLGFDYLNDNMVHAAEARLQRGLDFAIVDEVDSILIDEARTPLAISGVAGAKPPPYQLCDAIAREFTPGTEEDDFISNDFAADAKTRQIHFSDDGYEKAEKIFARHGLLHDGGLYEAHNLTLMHHLVCALRARHLFARDRDYVVRERRIVVIDEHTGRPMPGRRWGDGLHQAIQAKEGLAIEPETQTLASVSLQNFYRGYRRLAGMTGTAATEADEFRDIYGLEVMPIPTHRTMVREDRNDLVFARRKAKLERIVADVKDCVANKRPVLVGTTTVESSEEIARLLAAEGVGHDVLNAKQHEREASIIAQAGMPGKVTIATSMAGRGTDIVLGGSVEAERAAVEAEPELDAAAKKQKLAELDAAWEQRHAAVVAAGGLHIIGTERHESRRIDNQLRGRAGRQGDPGSSVFFLSFEDPLMRVFADAKLGGLVDRLMADDDEPLEVGMVSRVIEKAQRRVEAYNYDIRKQLLEYDDIANDQRRIIYEQRRHIVDAADIAEVVAELVAGAVDATVGAHVPAGTPEEEWDVAGAAAAVRQSIGRELPLEEWLQSSDELDAAGLVAKAAAEVQAAVEANLARLGPGSLNFQKSIVLEILDNNWRAHLSALDHLRQGIGLRGFAQKNPKQEYRRESLAMFNAMLDTIRADATKILLAVRLREDAPPPPPPGAAPVQPAGTAPVPVQPAGAAPPPVQPAGAAPAAPAAPAAAAATASKKQQSPADYAKAGRNDPCPCGSGLKYKHCHGRK